MDLTSCYEKITTNNQSFSLFINTIEEYTKNYKTDFTKMSEQIKTVAEQSNVNEFTTYTLFLICILQPLKKLYENKDYTELWRLYDCEVKDKDINTLPTDTSLGRNFIEYMKTGKKIGYGHGIYIYRQRTLYQHKKIHPES